MVEIRKTIRMRETVLSELGVTASWPVARAVGMAVILNSFAGRFVDDLRPLFEAGAELGERLMPSSSSCSTVRLRPSPTARVQSSGSTAKWSTAALACTRCSASRCGPRSAAARR